MRQTGLALDPVMKTSLITLYGKALDARRSPSLLHDTMAAEAFDKLGADVAALGVSPRMALSAAARARHFDDWAAEFLSRHERATVLHLGAGLDTRVWRLDPGPGVAWYDVDQPEVAEVRRRLYPERPGYRLVASSVTANAWLQEVRDDLPALVIAEGLTMYLLPEEGRALFRRVTGHFPSGVIMFDTHNRLAAWALNRRLRRISRTPMLRWAISDPGELERAIPRLRCTAAVSALAAPSTAGLSRALRAVELLTRPVPVLHDAGLYLRYAFDGTAR
ncbi:class I SAM-dependent methyltransferase [Nonomuraea pusilla]|uniref:Methyltransferase, TIGR00027 family n=1 Tax=Nonomuraea pusilla TaxID=46177 RepID=A0A1H7V9F5_9ACTN|nr:class I SAM-dependent methyltransferase [Nonomuraea pusilla]SEM05891.1 methyltransferase, TIGR00027 family [Nonomuraea pusilla]